MKNWKYIEGAKTGNIDINDMRSEKEKIIKQIKDLKDERAGWLRYQETHKDDTQLAEKIKGYTKEISDLQNKLLKVGNAFSDSYEFYLSAGKNDLNTIKDKINKEGGWTAETKAMARKTSESLLKKAKEIVEIAHKQSSELEKLARDIQSI